MMEYLGRRYDSCWDFVRKYYEAEFGLRLQPAACQDKHIFCPVQKPREGDVILFEQHGVFDHAGIYYYQGVLHHDSTLGVIYSQKVKNVAIYRCLLQRPAVSAAY